MNKAKIKIVGNKKQDKNFSPSEAYSRSLKLIRAMDRVNPYHRPRGFVYKAKTWEEYEEWRKQQDNPRLW